VESGWNRSGFLDQREYTYPPNQISERCPTGNLCNGSDYIWNTLFDLPVFDHYPVELGAVLQEPNNNDFDTPCSTVQLLHEPYFLVIR
jgi:hypothetical protein